MVLDGYTLTEGDRAAWSALDRLGNVEIFDRSSPDEVLARAQAARVLIVNKARIGTDVIEASSRLRLIAVTATGYDCVDVVAASRRGIAVANVPEYGTDSVAQFTFALLLELCHRVGLHAEAVRSGDWSRSPDFCFWRTPQLELAGLTLGIIGYGRIGRRVGEIAAAFGMRVLACSRQARRAGGVNPLIERQSAHDQGADAPRSPVRFVSMDDLVSQSDVISLHCPLTNETRGLINRELLRRMKPTAFLINTSRGGLVVDADLADALNSAGLAGAALDVISSEPVASDNPLLTARNCLITPHIAWATTAARRRLLDCTIANVEAFLTGRPINIVRDLSTLK